MGTSSNTPEGPGTNVPRDDSRGASEVAADARQAVAMANYAAGIAGSAAGRAVLGEMQGLETIRAYLVRLLAEVDALIAERTGGNDEQQR